MSDSIAIAVTTTPIAALAPRARRPKFASSSAVPMMRYEIEAGGPMRIGAAAALWPHGRSNSRVSIPRSIPVTCSTKVRPPTTATMIGMARAIARHRGRDEPFSSSVNPLRIAHAAAFGNIEMPSFRQSVNRTTSVPQPISVTSPPNTVYTPTAATTPRGHVATASRARGRRTGRTRSAARASEGVSSVANARSFPAPMAEHASRVTPARHGGL